MNMSKKIEFRDRIFDGFLVDEMHGKLLKWLRILGYYSEDVSVLLHDRKDIGDSREISWMIFDYSQNKKLILLSSNSALCDMVPHSFYLDLRDFMENLIVIKRYFNLQYDYNLNHSFCPVCGSELKYISDKSQVKDLVPPFTFSQQSEFWQCNNIECNKVFWRGSHVENFKKIFDKISG